MGMVAAFNEGQVASSNANPRQFSLAYAWLVWQFSHNLVGICFAYRASFWHLGSPFASPAWPVIPVYGTAISCSFPPSQIWPVTFWTATLWITHFLSEVLRGMHAESGRERASDIICVLIIT